MTVSQSRRSDTDASRDATDTVRLGVIDYLNVVPVYDWLLRQERELGTLPGVRTVRGVPAEMNRALAAGEIDISNVSSFAFGTHVDDWLLVPRLSVAADGRVDSVLLFSWHRDWRELDGGSIALTSHSATSVALVRLLCEQRWGIRPRLVSEAPDLDSMLARHDGALLIGDTALVEGTRRREIAGRGRPYVFDLAREWKDWTGLPFVFAVWAARRVRVSALRASGVVDLLRVSREHGVADLDRIARAAAERVGLSQGVCRAYLDLLDYQLTAEHLRGLRLFLERALPGFTWDRVMTLNDYD